MGDPETEVEQVSSESIASYIANQPNESLIRLSIIEVDSAEMFKAFQAQVSQFFQEGRDWNCVFSQRPIGQRDVLVYKDTWEKIQELEPILQFVHVLVFSGQSMSFNNINRVKRRNGFGSFSGSFKIGYRVIT